MSLTWLEERKNRHANVTAAEQFRRLIQANLGTTGQFKLSAYLE